MTDTFTAMLALELILTAIDLVTVALAVTLATESSTAKLFLNTVTLSVGENADVAALAKLRVLELSATTVAALDNALVVDLVTVAVAANAA